MSFGQGFSICCVQIFKRISANDNPDITFKVEASMMEIYSEKVRDLFNPKNPLNNGPGTFKFPIFLYDSHAGLPVRGDTKTGPFVVGLAMCALSLRFEEYKNVFPQGCRVGLHAHNEIDGSGDTGADCGVDKYECYFLEVDVPN